MIRSMTGFGLGEAEEGGVSVRVEARSVNHRHLQLKTRLPHEWSELEPELESLARTLLARGAVTVTVHVTRAAQAVSYAIDETVALRYRHALSRFAQEHGLVDALSLGELVQLPGVVSTGVDPERHEREGRLVLAAARRAVERLVEARGEEGGRTAADVARQLDQLEAVRAQVVERMPKVVQRHHQALQRRLAELLGEPTRVAETDLARELALLADRMDVSEELERLGSHLVQARSLLARGGEVGRRFDFLVQELFREANTLGSKCNDAEVAHAVIELKATIERIREQVQNLE